MKKFLLKIIGIMSVFVMFLTTVVPADVMYLPDVTEEMMDPDFWTKNRNADKVLAGSDEIQEINQSILNAQDCNMTDLANASRYIYEKDLYRSLWAGALADSSSMIQTPHYDYDNRLITGQTLLDIMQNIGGEHARYMNMVQYGICVQRADITVLPTDMIASDEKGNPDFNDLQISHLRVNEPVLIKAATEDGRYFYCTSAAVSGWVLSENIAVCKDREEWFEAWDIPEDELLVVTGGKVYLEASNNNPSSSLVMLPMGTVLRRVSDEDFSAEVTGRSRYQNYAVWLPVREEDGSYSRTIALISQNREVSEGYLPLTLNNILKVAFRKLGDIYGWGGMLDSVDCSGYIRDIYQCFGLVLPRNTTWQAAMPVYKYDVSEASDEEKEKVLHMMRPGAILVFKGHEMLYLGHVNGHYYVISSLSGIKDFESDSLLNVGGIVINTLDTLRMNGNSWLTSIHTILVPYIPAPESGPVVISAESEASARP